MKVLVVEDSVLVTNILKLLISQQSPSIEAVFCATLAEAQAHLDRSVEQFYMALVDLNLPDAPSGEIVDLTLSVNLPTVVLTGSYNEQRREALLNQGVVDYVVKESHYSYEFAAHLVKRLYTNSDVRILLVDDSASCRILLRNQLERYRYQVIEAPDGETALNILRSEPDIRILITDYYMPKMDGVQLVQLVRRVLDKSDLVLIGLSSADSGALSAQFIKNGANDFLRKPFNYEELHCRVMQNLDSIDLLNQVRRTANEDVLTGLHNRRYLFEEGEKVLAHARQAGLPVSLAMVDLDHFKQINDRYGHDGGDAVLVDVAERFRRHLKDFLLARVGGEEFCILMEGESLEQAAQLMERFRRHIADSEVVFEEQAIPISMSGGVAAYESGSLSALISEADQLLYQAKEQGRNRIVVHDY